MRFVLAACVALACCAPTAPTSDAGGVATAPVDEVAAVCAAACARLAALGCAEGGATCAATCLHAQRARLTELRPACLAAAKSVDDVRACGSVVCETR